MPYHSAFSQHSDAAFAIGEIIGEMLERVGIAPDVAVLFLPEKFRADASNIVSTIQKLLKPKSLIGTINDSIIAGSREIENGQAMCLWAGNCIGDITSFRAHALSSTDGELLLEDLPYTEAHTLILLADPLSFPITKALELWETSHPALQIIGGLTSGRPALGHSCLIVDDDIHESGAVGLLVSGMTNIKPIVSQGCRPIGDPFTVTSSKANVIESLGNQTALTRLRHLFNSLSESEKNLVNTGLHIGRVINENQLDFGRGDFLIRAVLGADQETGHLVIGDEIEVGAIIQFHVRDAQTAKHDLLELTNPIGQSDGALVFSCNGRGINLFGESDHDSRLVADLVNAEASAGMFCAGEIGPIGQRSFLHGFTASIAFFSD
ncbi:MAG: FIST N-terminal domain-containing protein [Actinomycetota bacterium]|nr:FIST N-terminal domain-containing protein [Actinomycetota bacterium]MDG1489482.1 FIST N-terminal domain-containing protein [Actinomycetota bacterium]MDG2119924.1 FIST N-terminal domain-containing protein [Actinomycetota bacterium]